MTRRPRLYVDLTFTRTQHVNVGITRTVNRLFSEFQSLAPPQGMDCVPVVFHTTGFREAASGRSGGAIDGPGVVSARRPVRARFMDVLRRCVTAYFPLWLRHWIWSVFSWWQFNHLSRGLPAIEVERGDVIFLCDASWNYAVWRAARRARQHGAKVVVVLYDLIPLRQPEYCPPIHTLVFRKWLSTLLRHCDGILCISRAVEDDLRRYAAETGCTLPSVANFRLGSDLVTAVQGVPAVRESLTHFAKNTSCFTAIGSFEPRKNYAFLLRAFEALWQRDVDARLLIIGRKDVQCRELLDRVENHAELGHRLLAIFDGSDAEVQFGYRNSAALVFPSLSEGFGLPLVEARAHGCRVIASDLPVFVELADSGVSIYPRGSQEALETLVLRHLADPDWDRTSPAPFTWAHSASQCMKFFMQLHVKTK